MKRRRVALLVVVGLVAAAVWQPVHAQSLPPVARVRAVVDSLARDFLARRQAPSVAIGLVRGTDTIALDGWGTADLEQEVPASAPTVYRIGSVTKQFTAAAIMQLREQGRLRLEDSIAAYVAGLPAGWRPVTIRQLLNHTSGIPSYTDIGPRWTRRWGQQMPPDSIIALTFADTMWFSPGTAWRYDNTGYVLLGMVIEKLAGRPWGEDMRQRFFLLLGLNDTHVCLNTPVIPHRAPGYEPGDSTPWQNADYLAMTQPYAAGALCSTVGDLARWNRALHTGKVVADSSYRLMTTPEGAAAHAALHYGFGLAADTLAGQRLITHGGGIHGFTTGNAWVPGAGLSVTVLANSGSANTGSLLKQLVRAALGAPLDQPPAPVALTPDLRDLLVGVYRLQLPGETRDFTVAANGDHLTGQLAGQGAITLIYLGNRTFGADFDPNLRIIFEPATGRASGFTLRQGGTDFRATRK